MATLPFRDLELCYDDFAEALDSLPEAERDVYMAKLILCLMHELGDGARIKALIQSCLSEPSFERLPGHVSL